MVGKKTTRVTAYLGHVIVGMGVLEMFDRLAAQSLTFTVGSALLFWALFSIFAYNWRR